MRQKSATRNSRRSRLTRIRASDQSSASRPLPPDSSGSDLLGKASPASTPPAGRRRLGTAHDGGHGGRPLVFRRPHAGRGRRRAAPAGCGAGRTRSRPGKRRPNPVCCDLHGCFTRLTRSRQGLCAERTPAAREGALPEMCAAENFSIRGAVGSCGEARLRIWKSRTRILLTDSRMARDNGGCWIECGVPNSACGVATAGSIASAAVVTRGTRIVGQLGPLGGLP